MRFRLSHFLCACVHNCATLIFFTPLIADTGVMCSKWAQISPFDRCLHYIIDNVIILIQLDQLTAQKEVKNRRNNFDNVYVFFFNSHRFSFVELTKKKLLYSADRFFWVFFKYVCIFFTVKLIPLFSLKKYMYAQSLSVNEEVWYTYHGRLEMVGMYWVKNKAGNLIRISE